MPNVNEPNPSVKRQNSVHPIKFRGPDEHERLFNEPERYRAFNPCGAPLAAENDFITIIRSASRVDKKTGEITHSTKPLAKKPKDKSYNPSAQGLFDYETIPVCCITCLEHVTAWLAENPLCAVIRGVLTDPDDNRHVYRRLNERINSKTGEIELPNIEDVAHRWLAMDMDDVPLDDVDPMDIVACHAKVVATLPSAFRAARIILSLTGSHSFRETIRARVWLWLDRPLDSAQVKVLLAHIEHDDALDNPVQLCLTSRPVFDSGDDPVTDRMRTFGGAAMAVAGSVKADGAPRVVKRVKALTAPLGHGRVAVEKERPDRPIITSDSAIRIAANSYRHITEAADRGLSRHVVAFREACFLFKLALDGMIGEPNAEGAIRAACAAVGLPRPGGQGEVDRLVADVWRRMREEHDAEASVHKAGEDLTAYNNAMKEA